MNKSLGLDEVLLEFVAEAEKKWGQARADEDAYNFEAWLGGHIDDYEQKIRALFAEDEIDPHEAMHPGTCDCEPVREGDYEQRD